MGLPYRVAVYLVLLIAGIPWYWPQDDVRIVLGLPAWVIMAVVVAVCTSVFTAWCLSRSTPPQSTDE